MRRDDVHDALVSRRTFLRSAAASAAGLTAAGAGVVGALPLPKGLQLGVQAGSIRAALTRDFSGTLAQIAAIGFTEIELQWYGGNFGMSPSQLRAAFDRAGLRASSALIHSGAMIVGWERHLSAAKEIGLTHLAVVNFSEDERQSLADWHEWADRFNRAGEVARKAGVWLALHNEPQFMAPIDGRIPYDEFVARTDPALVALELDVGNMTRAGHDPVPYLQRHRQRYRLLHLKDVPPEGQDGDRPLGKGRVDFRRILAALSQAGDNKTALVPALETHAFVEHAVDPAAPIESMRGSFQHLAGLQSGAADQR